MENHNVKLTVMESGCGRYQVGDVIRFKGAFIDKDQSSQLCMVALNAVYPFVYAARRGGEKAVKQGVIQCPDCSECVKFQLALDEE